MYLAKNPLKVTRKLSSEIEPHTTIPVGGIDGLKELLTDVGDDAMVSIIIDHTKETSKNGRG